MKVYDASEVTVSLGGVPLSGYADGDFCRIEEDADRFSDQVGADGEVVRSKSNDRRATVTIILQQSSDSNDVLSGIYTLDANSPNGLGVGALLIRDRNGRSIYTAGQAWIAKRPSVTFGKESGTREWKIRCAKLLPFDGGNVGPAGGLPL